MKEIYLVYRVDFIVDEKYGDDVIPLWCCSSLEKAENDVNTLLEAFRVEKEDNNLQYDVRFYYKVLDLR